MLARANGFSPSATREFWGAPRPRVDRGPVVELGKLHPPGVDEKALTEAAKFALDLYLSKAKKAPKLPAAVKAGKEIEAVTDEYGAPVLATPLMFKGAATEDYVLGSTMTSLFEKVPALRRFSDVECEPAEKKPS